MALSLLGGPIPSVAAWTGAGQQGRANKMLHRSEIHE